MKQLNIKKHMSLFLCMMLIAAMALVTTGCNDNKKTQSAGSEPTVVGEGNTVFDFSVVDATNIEEGKTYTFKYEKT